LNFYGNLMIASDKYLQAVHSGDDYAAALQWEMYDLATDHLERWNLADVNWARTTEQEEEFARLQAELKAVEQERLQPFAWQKLKKVRNRLLDARGSEPGKAGRQPAPLVCQAARRSGFTSRVRTKPTARKPASTASG
jgi:hypothetical protein